MNQVQLFLFDLARFTLDLSQPISDSAPESAETQRNDSDAVIPADVSYTAINKQSQQITHQKINQKTFVLECESPQKHLKEQ